MILILRDWLENSHKLLRLNDIQHLGMAVAQSIF